VPADVAAADAVASAEAAGLHYVSDHDPGIGRRQAGRGFSYLGLDGRPIRDRAELRRIKALAIPPAWTDVWISPDPLGHIQATGRDAKGRKQYRYHERWRVVRDETKFGRMLAFGEALPAIRRQTAKDLARPGMPREKVLATVVRLLETTLIRVGNEEYARTNASFGLTTMRDEHAEVVDSKVRFHFRGKSGVEHEVEIRDKRLAAMVKRCQDLPGQELFQYTDGNGERRAVTSDDVNAYLRDITGEAFTAKDFRTWAGTVLAAEALQEFGEFDSEAQAKRNILRAVEAVAARLGNTRTICRKSYVHPAVLESYADGTMLRTLQAKAERELSEALPELPPEEAAVLALLRERLSSRADATAAAP
jgi:DNA topoisomerase-1